MSYLNIRNISQETIQLILQYLINSKEEIESLSEDCQLLQVSCEKLTGQVAEKNLALEEQATQLK